jgi:hypothetical protein
MNSPCEALNREAIVADIQLALNTPIYQDKILIVVEGTDDESLYFKFFNTTNTRFKPTYGCLHYEYILGELDSLSNKFIILRDADFDHLNNKEYVYQNLFLTDTHDLETMMINDTVMRNICIEYLKEEIPNFIQTIYSHLAPLSYIKWYNNKHNIRLNFGVLKIPSIYSCVDICISDWLNKIYSYTENNTVAQIQEADIVQYQINNPCDNHLLLINGHDLCDYISIWLRKENLSCTNVNKKKIAQYLMTNYSVEDFKTTEMYRKINSWGERYSYKLFL